MITQTSLSSATTYTAASRQPTYQERVEELGPLIDQLVAGLGTVAEVYTASPTGDGKAVEGIRPNPFLDESGSMGKESVHFDFSEGGTDDAKALETALELLNERPEERAPMVLVFTDGELDTPIYREFPDGVSVIGIGVAEGHAGLDPEVYSRMSVLPRDLDEVPKTLAERLRDLIAEDR